MCIINHKCTFNSKVKLLINETKFEQQQQQIQQNNEVQEPNRSEEISKHKSYEL